MKAPDYAARTICRLALVMFSCLRQAKHKWQS